MHRPSPSSYGIHVSLLHPAFGKFMDNYSSVKLDRHDLEFTLEFCHKMSLVFEQEENRTDLASELLGAYIGRPLTKIEFDHCRPDASISVTCGPNPGINKFFCFIREDKVELGENGSPLEQLMGYYLKAYNQCGNKNCYISSYPMLLMTLTGPYFSISAAACSFTAVMDPLTPILPLLVLPYDKEMMILAAKALKSLKWCIEDLMLYYSEISSNPPPSSNQFQFPYKREFEYMGRVYKMTYESQFSVKLVFICTVEAPQISTSSNEVSPQVLSGKVVVKFSKSYCVGAHKVCSNFNRCAPDLYYSETLPGGWTMIVMEYLENCAFVGKHSSSAVKSKLLDAMENLHSNKYVHGDLRWCNILLGSNDRACIIDFDWSGRIGETNYPAFMNHTDITWPDKAEDFMTILVEHDEYLLKEAIGDWESSITPTEESFKKRKKGESTETHRPEERTGSVDDDEYLTEEVIGDWESSITSTEKSLKRRRKGDSTETHRPEGQAGNVSGRPSKRSKQS